MRIGQRVRLTAPESGYYDVPGTLVCKHDLLVKHWWVKVDGARINKPMIFSESEMKPEYEQKLVPEHKK